VDGWWLSCCGWPCGVLKHALGCYAEHRAAGPVKARFAATTWGQHMSILSIFYRWTSAEGHARAEPFTYRVARALFEGTSREVRVNLVVRRTPKPHVTIKYLESDFVELFLRGVRTPTPTRSPRSSSAYTQSATDHSELLRDRHDRFPPRAIIRLGLPHQRHRTLTHLTRVPRGSGRLCILH
jgi:hypothetical protein